MQEQGKGKSKAKSKSKSKSKSLQESNETRKQKSKWQLMNADENCMGHHHTDAVARPLRMEFSSVYQTELICGRENIDDHGSATDVTVTHSGKVV
jgi:hypothetical protein